MTTNTPEEEAMLTQEYAEYMEWCRKWIVPPAVLSYEDFWRMAADNAKKDFVHNTRKRPCHFCGHNEGDERRDVVIYGPYAQGICNVCIELAAEEVRKIRIRRATKD